MTALLALMFFGFSGAAFGQLLGGPMIMEAMPPMVKTEKEIGGREAATSHMATPIVSGGRLLVPLDESPVVISPSVDEGHFFMDSTGVYQVSPNGEELLIQDGNFTAGKPWMLSANNRLMFSFPTIQGRSLIGTKSGSLSTVKVIDSANGGGTDMIVGSILIGRDSPGGATMVGWIDRPTVRQIYAGMYIWEGDVLRKFWAQTPGKPGSGFPAQATRKYVYFLVQEQGGPWILSRYSRTDGTTVVIKSGITPIDGEGFGGLHATEDSVAFIHKDTSGKYRFSRYNDGPRVTPTEECLIKDCSETISGVSLNESWGHAYHAGILTFIMKTGGGNALFQIKAGVGEMLISPSDFPQAKPAGSISSAGRFYTMLSEGSIGRPLNRVYTLLKPELSLGSANTVRGELGKEVVLPCSDCPAITTLAYEVSVAGKKIPATNDGRGQIRFPLPAGIPAGVHDVVLSISGLELRFRLEVVELGPKVVTPRISGAYDYNAEGHDRQFVSPGELITLRGKDFCFPTSAPIGASVVGEKRLAGCQVRVESLGDDSISYANMVRAWTLDRDGSAYVDIVVPETVSSRAVFVVERFDAAQKNVEATSQKFVLDVVETAPLILGVYQGFKPMSGENYAVPGSYLEVYLTGFGKIEKVEGVEKSILPVSVFIGDKKVELAAEKLLAPGVYQINFQVPLDFRIGVGRYNAPISIEVGGRRSTAFLINFSN